MAGLHYRDPGTGTWKKLATAGAAGPQGPAGPTGPAGPNGVSTDSRNNIVLGTDNRVWAPEEVQISVTEPISQLGFDLWVDPVGPEVPTIAGPTGPAGPAGPTGPAGSNGITRSINSISGDTTFAAVAQTDYVYICTAGLTATLPTAVGNTSRYTVKRTGTGGVTVNTINGQTIDGQPTFILAAQYQAIDLVSDGADWSVI